VRALLTALLAVGCNIEPNPSPLGAPGLDRPGTFDVVAPPPHDDASASDASAPTDLVAPPDDVGPGDVGPGDVGPEDAPPPDDDVPVDIPQQPPCPSGVICVDELPFAHAGDTTTGVSVFDAYACAPQTDESGPEIVYRVEVSQAGFLTAAVTDGDGVDVDVHLLAELDAGACVARGHHNLGAQVDAGTWWIVVDSWVDGSGVAQAGAYELSIDLKAGGDGCAADMQLVAPGTVAPVCMDRFEAPNTEAGLALVMSTFDEAAAWCEARGKRLCFDDEWTAACEGPKGYAYPYGDTHQPGVCNDDKTWKAYDQQLLSGWPWGLAFASLETLAQVLDAAAATGAPGAASAAHVEALYQGTEAGANTGCGGAYGVFDLTGNVEEWTRRRDGGTPGFHGNLKGRYWAEPRTCQQGVKSHGDAFRFYEIGFRCCADPD